MNRQQRRQAAKEGHRVIKDRTYTIKDSDLLKIKDKVCAEVSDEVTHKVLVTMAICLHDDFGFGQTRIMRVIKHIEDYMQNIIDGEIDFEDVNQSCIEELGINVLR